MMIVDPGEVAIVGIVFGTTAFTILSLVKMRVRARDHRTELGEPNVSERLYRIEQAVDDLVDGAVTAEGDDDLDAGVRRLPRQRTRVAATAGVADLQINLAAQRAGEHIAAAGAGGGGLGVDDEEGSHGGHGTLWG